MIKIGMLKARPIKPAKRIARQVLEAMHGLLEQIVDKGDQPVWPKTVAQYARMVGKSPRAVHRWIKDGHLTATDMPGMDLMIAEQAHQAFAAGRGGKRAKERMLMR